MLRDGEERFIYNLVTKSKYFHKPTYSSLEESLRRLKDHAEENSVHHLAMPKIGCGLDKMEWNKVKDLIGRVFEGASNIEILVYYL